MSYRKAACGIAGLAAGTFLIADGVKMLAVILAAANARCHDTTDRDPLVDTEAEADVDSRTLSKRYEILARKYRNAKDANRGLRAVNAGQGKMLHRITNRLREIIADP